MKDRFQPDIKNFEESSSSMNSELLFKGSRFEIRRKNQWEFINHPGATVILPLLDEKNVIMIRNERYAVGELLWELPAGTLEPKEHPQQTAARELIEETGYEAGQIDYLTWFYTTPGFCNERMFAYTAKDLKYVGQNLDESEKISVEIITWVKILQMIQKGDIRDAKSIATLLFYSSFCQ